MRRYPWAALGTVQVMLAKSPYPRTVRRKHGRGIEHLDEMAALVHVTSRALVAEAFTISITQPFKERGEAVPPGVGLGPISGPL